MKKKLFIIFLTVMASACFALGLSACTGNGGDDPEQGSGDGHTHNISYVAAETATCTQDGHVEYWYCADCGKYFTDVEGNNETTLAQLAISATGHEWSEWQTTKPATCTEDGLQKRVCEKCGEEESDTVIAAGHSPADPVRENEVPATCTQVGSYDEVVYCEVCDTEISRTSKTIEKIAHTSANPVRENEVPATCTKEGSYDEVIYCEVCDEEISRTSKTIDKLAHTYSDEWSFDDTYHWHAATCCDTGAVSDKAVHTVEGGVCTLCNVFVGTMGLIYILSDDRTYYIVSNIGAATDAEIIIPPEHNGLPVTTIGEDAFAGCTSLTSITIPDGVTSIADSAFRDCSSLESIIIPDSVTSIGDSAFSGCSSLESIVVESGNTVYHSFGNCIIETATKTLVAGCKTSKIPNDGSVTSIGDSAFSGCTSLTNITIPDGVTSIGEWAFSGCTNITTATMPAIAIDYIPQDNLQTVVITSGDSIGDYAFYNCSSLTSITIGDSVTSIGDYAFYGCDTLTSITIPDGVTSIGEDAFEGCTNLIQTEGVVRYVDRWVIGYYMLLTNVVLRDDTVGIANSAFHNFDSLESITIPDSVISIGEDAFYGCTSLESVTIPDSVTSIGDEAFADCGSLERIYYQGDLTSWCGISGLNNLMSIVRTLYINGEELSGELVIPDGIIYIGDYAFYDCDLITSVTIPDSVTSIGNSAFSGCGSLESVTIGNGVTSIGNSAFSGCGSLESVTIGNGVTSIGGSAFGYCDSLTSVTIPDSVTSIGGSAFGYCFSLKSVTIGNGVTKIGHSAFRNTSLTSIIIPDSVTSISDRTFASCTSLKRITIPYSVTYIGDEAFAGCSSLESIYYQGDIANWCGISGLYELMDSFRTLYINGEKLSGKLVISDGVTVIPDYAFHNCRSLESIIIPDSVTEIGAYAFRKCISLTSITIGNGATSIGAYAFEGCTSLESITIGNGATSIGAYAFEGCTSLESITIGNGVTSIGAYAFNGCTSLESITIPDSVTYIDSYAFQGCSSLKNIYYQGDITSWCGISGLDELMSSVRTLYINGEELSDELVIPDGITDIPDSAFNGCDLITSIIIPDSVTSIGRNAFAGCSSLTSITIPDSVTSIGYYAFEGCTSLESITIPDSVISIGSSAFQNCDSLECIYYQGDIASWCGISGLNNLMGLGRTLYINGEELSGELVIPNGIAAIPNYAFRNCNLITSIIISDSVTKIGNYAFYGCSSLDVVYYIGTESDWAEISIGSNNGDLTAATRYYYSETQPTEEGNFWHYAEDGVTPVIWIKDTTES